jgi:hypothetical protein
LLDRTAQEITIFRPYQTFDIVASFTSERNSGRFDILRAELLALCRRWRSFRGPSLVLPRFG